MATVGEQIKESLLGAATEPQLSDTSRHEFLQHAHKAEDGEYYLDEQEFINAIAPASEDYVCLSRAPFSISEFPAQTRTPPANTLSLHFLSAR